MDSSRGTRRSCGYGNQLEESLNLEYASPMDLFSVGLSATAVVVSITNAYLTLFRRGRVRMTQPTTIFFGPDGANRDEPSSKVYLRTLLYSTAKRGKIIESMFVRLRRGESVQTFNIWVYGEDALSPGSGLYVGENGVACNHHFLLPQDGTRFEFLAGEYKLEVYASVVGARRPHRLAAISLTVTERLATQLQDKKFGAYFDWGPDSQQYHAHVRNNSRLLAKAKGASAEQTGTSVGDVIDETEPWAIIVPVKSKSDL